MRSHSPPGGQTDHPLRSPLPVLDVVLTGVTGSIDLPPRWRAEPELASVLVTHHLEELPATTSHALLLAHGRTVARGPIHEVVTTETITRAFEHPTEVSHVEGRRSAAPGAVRELHGEVPGDPGQARISCMKPTSQCCAGVRAWAWRV
ncbi:hypothetical protein [Amycolatopsis rhizosphaerae]|uniref:hypothetical protein n=1 Tax=Amycolatopsis rhizosphaerae TaxID=2053003 RepID=UPI001643CFA5|nr:hypothetical protein [Amycolatopsis rhizosphaerae]